MKMHRDYPRPFVFWRAWLADPALFEHWLPDSTDLTYELSTAGSQLIQITDPQFWDELPEDTLSARPLPTFWSRLITLLLQNSYPDSVIRLYCQHLQLSSRWC